MITIHNPFEITSEEIYSALSQKWMTFLHNTELRNLKWNISQVTNKVILHAAGPGSTIIQMVPLGQRINITVLVRGADIRVFDYAGRFFLKLKLNKP